jgi:polyisoprenoid-binding protein YceI
MLFLLALVTACDGDFIPEVAATATSMPTAVVASPAMNSIPPTPTRILAPGEVLVALGDGTVGRYLVQEQLARRNLPNDAIGETSEVTGAIVFGADGAVKLGRSGITVNLQALVSDESRRDTYLRTNAIQSNTYPEATFVLRDVVGLPWPLPVNGDVAFQLIGDMTVHGETNPLRWDVTATFSDGAVAGQATTRFTFGEYGMSIPKLLFILSVEEDIRLELDFVAEVMRGR